MRAGDIINCIPNTPHWHSSTVNSSVSYLALYSPSPTQWDRPLTDDEYASSLLRTLFDEFAALADEKDVEAQMQLFAPNAVVESYRDGQASSTLSGKDEIETTFSNFLNQFDTVEHKNGEHRVEINGNIATGYGSCNVTLINSEAQLQWTVNYTDTYIFDGSRWLIQKRKSYFD